MKECRYCRTKYDDNLAVCPNCGGTKVVTEQELAEEEALIQREAEYRERANAVPEMRKRGMIGVLVVAIVCLIGVIAAVSYNANKLLSNGMSKDEGEEILAEGIAHFDNGEYELAMECFQRLPSDSKQYEEAQSLLQKSKDSYRSEILNRVDTYIENGEYDLAFNLINQAGGMFPGDSDLQTAYDKAYSAYQTSVLQQVDFYVESGQYEIALEYLSNVQTQYPNDTVLQDTYNSTLFSYQNVVRSDAMQQANDYVANGDYVQAISVLESSMDKIGQDGELVAQLNVYKDTYKNGILQQVATLYDTDGYESVISLLEQAKSILPEDNDLAAEYTLWQSRRPLLLTELEEYTNDGLSVNDTLYNTDNYGTSYSSSIMPTSSYVGSEHYIEYYLENKYAKFEAILYITEGARDSATVDEAIVSIYGDDVLICTYSNFSPKDKPKEIVVDISNVEFLKIQFTHCTMGVWADPQVGLASPTVGW